MNTTLPSPSKTKEELAATPEQQLQTPAGFVAPKTHHGQPVAYHPNGVRSKNPAIGLVLNNGMRGAVTLRLLGNRQVIEAVAHIDDPRLKESADRRENGAWDLTDYDKARAADLRDLQQWVNDKLNLMADTIRKAITKTVAEPVSGSNKGDREKLLAQAKEMGITITGQPGVEKLQQLISEKLASVAG